VLTNKFDAREYEVCIGTLVNRVKSFVPALRPIVLPERSKTGEVDSYLCNAFIDAICLKPCASYSSHFDCWL